MAADAQPVRPEWYSSCATQDFQSKRLYPIRRAAMNEGKTGDNYPVSFADRISTLLPPSPVKSMVVACAAGHSVLFISLLIFMKVLDTIRAFSCPCPAAGGIIK